MRKIVVHRAGGYEQLSLESAENKAAGPGDVVIDVAFSGVNYADCIVRMGLYESAKKYVGWPIVPGFEVAGTVVTAPTGGKWRAGDRVMALTRFGGYASRVVVPDDQVFALPDGLSLDAGAGLLATSLTAYHALVELAAPRAGAAVLVHSAAGGVGSMLLQLARVRGAFVVGVVGGRHKVDEAAALGADVVIDKSSEHWASAARRARRSGYAAVFDANGAETLRDSYELLASPGRLVVYGFHSMLPKQGGRANLLKLARTWLATPRFSPLAMTGENRSVMAFNLSYLFAEKQLLADATTSIADSISRGALRPARTQVFPATQVADAHRALESGRTVGKLVLAW